MHFVNLGQFADINLDLINVQHFEFRIVVALVFLNDLVMQ